MDEEHDFAPHYEVIDAKKKVVSELRSAPPRPKPCSWPRTPTAKGRPIAWHVAELIKDKAKDIKRIQFNEITARAVKEALACPRPLNAHLFEAQQARRVLDRLVGYKISPLLWKTVKRGISAGRVQSVALRLIVEREEAREAFKPEEYWLFRALLAGETPPSFKADLAKINNKKAVVANAARPKSWRPPSRGSPLWCRVWRKRSASAPPSRLSSLLPCSRPPTSA